MRLSLIFTLGWCCVACSGGPTLRECRPSAAPTLEIGLGVGAYDAVADGADMVLVHGPQGGRHLELGFLATGLAADALVSGEITAQLTGPEPQDLAMSRWLDFRCDETARGLVSVGTTLVVDQDTQGVMDGTVAAIELSVTDLDAVTVHATKQVVIRDLVQ